METLSIETIRDLKVNLIVSILNQGGGDILVKKTKGYNEAVSFLKFLCADIVPSPLNNFSLTMTNDGLLITIKKQQGVFVTKGKEAEKSYPDSNSYLRNGTYRGPELRFRSLCRLYTAVSFPVDEKSLIAMLPLKNKNGSYNLLASLVSDHNLFSYQIREETRGKITVNDLGHGSFCALLRGLIYQPEGYIGETLSDKFLNNTLSFELFKEAVSNQIAHNAYQIGDPSLVIRDNEIEVVSYYVEGAKSSDNKPINEDLFKILKDLRLVKSTHYGLDFFNQNKDLVSIKRKDGKYSVVIKFDSIKPKEIESVGEVSGKTNGEKKTAVDALLLTRALEIIKKDNLIKRDDLAAELKISPRTLDRVIKALKDEGLILGRTSNKNGKWLLP